MGLNFMSRKLTRRRRKIKVVSFVLWKNKKKY